MNKVHFIAIGGSAMHNLAIALHLKGYHVAGSDDVFYEPSKSRLANYNLLPETVGWDAARITPDIDAIILGMHARLDNPELIAAQNLGLKIYSYPEFIFEQAKFKKRVVIGGSHGKTTITSMIMHVLNYWQFDFDYLVGAQLEGFDNMVRLSDSAPIMIIEGDEYLASPIDRRPKFHLYQANLAVLSGIAWDHINVFPKFEEYIAQFSKFIYTMIPGSKLFYCELDEILKNTVLENKATIDKIGYGIAPHSTVDGDTFLASGVPLKIFGNHNLMNLQAAKLICLELGIKDIDFDTAISSFKGASKRLELLTQNLNSRVFKDFAHSPSKLKATISAVKQQFSSQKLVACMELHTFSSLDPKFLGEYKNAMDLADIKIVFVDEKTFAQKNLKVLTEGEIQIAFGDNEVKYFNSSLNLINFLKEQNLVNSNFLFMSSGNFGGLDLNKLAYDLVN
ncbi:MAG: peptidoglycan synthetase [Pedobacter sp.]|nr:MAG: peptidoglycan synthetase [Pedobacter sp.]